MPTTAKRKPKSTQATTEPTALNPLIFISHDTRDADIAEAFSHLLSAVSMGVLKSFRSSDQKGTQGIEYGTEWYGEIMKKLDSASDVVCLLTARSVERPWILYEAGVAKGKLEKTVLGIAVGIPLKKAASGPFAQFQNCDDSEDKLTSLVMQLCKRVPNAEPSRDVIKQQVNEFKKKIAGLVVEEGEVEGNQEAEEASVAELFEEIKVMFQDLPSRIDRHVDPRRRRKFRGLHPMLIDEVMYMEGRSLPQHLGLLMALSLFKEDMPWLWEIGHEIYLELRAGRPRKAKDLFEQFQRVLDFSLRSDVAMEFYGKEIMTLRHEIPDLIFRAISSATPRPKAKKPRKSPEFESGEERQQLAKEFQSSKRQALD